MANGPISFGVWIPNTISMSVVVAAAMWVQISITEMRAELKLMMQDRFTGSMFIQVQDELENLNPDANWLKAGDVKEIQLQNAPYR